MGTQNEEAKDVSVDSVLLFSLSDLRQALF